MLNCFISNFPGVLMWEVFTCGKMPYGRLKNTEVVERVQRGIILERPKACAKEIYEVSSLQTFNFWNFRFTKIGLFLFFCCLGYAIVLEAPARGPSIFPCFEGSARACSTRINRLGRAKNVLNVSIHLEHIKTHILNYIVAHFEQKKILCAYTYSELVTFFLKENL